MYGYFLEILEYLNELRNKQANIKYFIIYSTFHLLQLLLHTPCPRFLLWCLILGVLEIVSLGNILFLCQMTPNKNEWAVYARDFSQAYLYKSVMKVNGISVLTVYICSIQLN